jgi:hypothetical protein
LNFIRRQLVTIITQSQRFEGWISLLSYQKGRHLDLIEEATLDLRNLSIDDIVVLGFDAV